MPAVLIALMLASQPAGDETLQELTRAYGQACASRLYGQYDDMCEGLAQQIRQYKTDLRRRPKRAAAPPSVALSAPPQAADAPPTPAATLPARPQG